jgi:hypothetical protein
MASPLCDGPTPTEVQAGRVSVHEGFREGRPLSTSRKYGGSDCETGCTRRWSKYCEAKGGDTLDGIIVTPLTKQPWNIFVKQEKVEACLIWLAETPKQTRRQVPVEGTKMSANSIESFLKALVDLQSTQKVQYPEEMRECGPVRSDTTRKLKETSARAAPKNKRATYADRGYAASVHGGYSEEQHRMLSEYGVKCGSPHPPRNAIVIGTRFHCGHLGRHNMILRADDQRIGQLPDLCALPLPAMEGPMPGMVVNQTHDQGKNIHDGHCHTSASMRADKPFECSHLALSMLFFVRWFISKIPSRHLSLSNKKTTGFWSGLGMTSMCFGATGRDRECHNTRARRNSRAQRNARARDASNVGSRAGVAQQVSQTRSTRSTTARSTPRQRPR